MDERPKLPHYDPAYCGKVARWAACACVAVFVIEVLIFIIADPSAGRCPGWIVVGEERPGTSLWIPVGTLAAPMAWMCYVALRWDQKFSQIMYDSIAYGRPRFLTFGFGKRAKPDPQDINFEQIFFLDANKLFLQVSIAWCLFCGFPLGLMLGCTSLPEYLGL